MVKRIHLSSRDRYTLNRLQENPINPSHQPDNYVDKVVIKPWGFEYLVFQNELVAIWFLHIKHGHGTSMHCHPKKKTSLIVLTGEALCNTLTYRNQLRGLDAIVLEKGVFHSTKSLSLDGANLIEIETPPDKTDLARLGDAYGRESSAYEGLSEMRTENLEEFGHFYTGNLRKGEKKTYRGSVYEITFNSLEDEETLNFSNDESSKILYALLQGQAVDSENRVVLDIGEATWADTLNELGPLTVPSDTIFLTIKLVDSLEIHLLKKESAS